MKGAGWEAQKKKAAALIYSWTLTPECYLYFCRVVTSTRVMSQPLSREFPLSMMIAMMYMNTTKSYDCVNHAVQSKDNLVIQKIIVRVLYSLLQSHSS
jgi:hypothetical protein